MILFRAASGSALLAALRFLVHGRPRASFGFLFGHAAMFVAFFDVLGLSPRGNVVPANESPGRNKMALAFDRQSVEQGLQLWTEPVAAERPQWNEACACQLLCVWHDRSLGSASTRLPTAKQSSVFPPGVGVLDQFPARQLERLERTTELSGACDDGMFTALKRHGSSQCAGAFGNIRSNPLVLFRCPRLRKPLHV
jgi:hypothetical protein